MARINPTDGGPAVATDYESLRHTAGLVDRSSTGRLRVSGEDASDLLNRLSTNNLEHLTTETGLATVLTTNKGRIIDLLYVLPAPDALLVLTSANRQKQVADWIEFYTFVEDVTVEDLTEDTAMLAVCGPDSQDAIRRALNTNVESLALFSPLQIDDLAGATLVRTDHFNIPTFELMAPREGVERAVDLFDQRGLEMVPESTAENLRVAMGVPSAAGELTEEFNPLEAGLRPHISFNKICYIGQEVVARLNAYEKVQRHLLTLEWEDEHRVPAAGLPLTSGGKEVGKLTSVGARRGSKGVALGYVRKAHVELGTTLAVEADDAPLTLTVTGFSGEV